MCDLTAAMGRGMGCGSRVVCGEQRGQRQRGLRIIGGRDPDPEAPTTAVPSCGATVPSQGPKGPWSWMLAGARPHLARPGLAVNTSGPTGIRLAGRHPKHLAHSVRIVLPCTCLSRARSLLEAAGGRWSKGKKRQQACSVVFFRLVVRECGTLYIASRGWPPPPQGLAGPCGPLQAQVLPVNRPSLGTRAIAGPWQAYRALVRSMIRQVECLLCWPPSRWLVGISRAYACHQTDVPRLSPLCDQTLQKLAGPRSVRTA